jgi:hypothetical protein
LVLERSSHREKKILFVRRTIIGTVWAAAAVMRYWHGLAAGSYL